jgi:hypothetical protein
MAYYRMPSSDDRPASAWRRRGESNPVRALCALSFALGVSPVACQKSPSGSAPTPTAPTTASAVKEPAAQVSASAPAASTAPAAAPSSSSAAADAGAEPAATAPVRPPLLDDAGAPLPQTEDRPSVESAFFRELGPALWQAIVDDDPDAALPWFFPVEAYRAVKAIADPDRDWETRLVRHFARDIHAYRMQLGKYRHEMQYVRVEVPADRAKWMKPHSEGNKLGYWRVLRAQLVYLDREQRERRLEITSMISWRGEWYVVHLHGFE